uniref:Uncharacterized protein n=1 Tax=Arundo donax TaxID=35708 RepID=A0A0A9A0P0_ARUDO
MNSPNEVQITPTRPSKLILDSETMILAAIVHIRAGKPIQSTVQH